MCVLNRLVANVALVMAMVAGTAFMALPANAMTWDLSNVVFADGGTATGTITPDGFGLDLTAWDITVSGGSDGDFPGFTFNTTQSSFTFSGPGDSLDPEPEIDFQASCCFDTDIKLILPVFSLPAAGGVVDLATTVSPFLSGGVNFISVQSISPNVNVEFQRFIVSGSLISETAATPLPATLPLFATGLGALGLFGWSRKRKNATLAT